MIPSKREAIFVLLVIFVFLALSFSFAASAASINADVTQDNIHQTVCVAGYTESIRPPISYTQEYERENGGGIDTVVDHKLPMCAGGNPTDYANLQLQYKAESYRKDIAERLVCKLLCEGKLTLIQAQRMFWQ